MLLPVSLALTAAALFALGNQCARMALRYTDSQTAAMFQIGVGAGFYWLATPFYLHWHYWTSPVLLLIAAAGLLRPILSANLSMAGTRILGPTISSTLAATAPLFGILLGVLILGEALTWPVAVGAAAIAAGVVALSWRRDRTLQWPLIALLLPVGAALLRSLAHAISKIGLEAIPSPFFIALVAYSVSLPLAVLTATRKSRAAARQWPVADGGARWLLVTGLAYSIAVLVLNLALLSGPLIVVSPLIACTPVFTMLLGYFVFQERSITRRVALAVLLVVPGVALIAAKG